MENTQDPLRSLNPEQLLSVVGDLMVEHMTSTTKMGYLLYQHEQLIMVIANEVPEKVQALATFTNDECIKGLNRSKWCRLRDKLAQLQTEVLACPAKSKQ